MNQGRMGRSEKSTLAVRPTDNGTGELNANPTSQVLPLFSEKSEDDSADARSRRILWTIAAFRDGNFSVRLPVDWVGTDGQIAEAFNQAILDRVNTPLLYFTSPIVR
jgi:hypothetical protein